MGALLGATVVMMVICSVFGLIGRNVDVEFLLSIWLQMIIGVGGFLKEILM